MVFIDDNNLINKSGTKTLLSSNDTKVCEQVQAIVY